MSPVFVAQKGVPPGPKAPPRDKTEERFSTSDWIWAGIAVFCTWLLLSGLHRLLTKPPEATEPPILLAAPTPTPETPPPAQPPAPRPTSTYMMHSQAVEATVKSLRQHAKECPDAPDVLTEEQIKVIEETGTLLL